MVVEEKVDFPHQDYFIVRMCISVWSHVNLDFINRVLKPHRNDLSHVSFFETS